MRIGPQIWGLVVELSREVAPRYPEVVYNKGLLWNSEEVEELAVDVVVECLLGEGQLQYIFDETETLESLKSLAGRQINWTLFRRHSNTVVGRLLVRIKKITAAPPFKVDLVGKERWITRETPRRCCRRSTEPHCGASPMKSAIYLASHSRQHRLVYRSGQFLGV